MGAAAACASKRATGSEAAVNASAEPQKSLLLIILVPLVIS
jgi:hypothetical protein